MTCSEYNYRANFSDFTYITWSISINNPTLNCTFVNKTRDLFYFDLWLFIYYVTCEFAINSLSRLYKFSGSAGDHQSCMLKAWICQACKLRRLIKKTMNSHKKCAYWERVCKLNTIHVRLNICFPVCTHEEKWRLICVLFSILLFHADSLVAILYFNFFC